MPEGLAGLIGCIVSRGFYRCDIYIRAAPCRNAASYRLLAHFPSACLVISGKQNTYQQELL